MPCKPLLHASWTLTPRMTSERQRYLQQEHHAWKAAACQAVGCSSKLWSQCLPCQRSVITICQLFKDADATDTFVLACICWLELFESIKWAMAMQDELEGRRANLIEVLSLALSTFEQMPPLPQTLSFVDLSPTFEESDGWTARFSQLRDRLCDLLPYGSCCRMLDEIYVLLDGMLSADPPGVRFHADGTTSTAFHLGLQPILAVLLSSDLEDEQPHLHELDASTADNLARLLDHFESALTAAETFAGEEHSNSSGNTDMCSSENLSLSLTHNKSFQHLRSLPFQDPQWHMAMKLVVNHDRAQAWRHATAALLAGPG